jgi:hypothetical protein
MAKSLILNIFGTPVTLPDPFSGVVLKPGRPGIVVDGDPDAVVAQLGGLENIRGFLTVSEALDVNPIDAVAFGLADAQAAAEAAAAGEPRTSFVYRPGDPLGTRENVYTDWPTMFAAMATVEGYKKVFVDDSFTSPAVVPAGSYDLTDVNVEGIDKFLTPLHFADGVVFTSDRMLLAFSFRGVRLRNLGTSAVITMTTSQVVNLDVTIIEATGSAPLISTAGAGNVLGVSAFSTIADVGTPPVEVTSGTLFVLAREGALIEDDVFSGAGNVLTAVASNSARIGDQTTLGGTFSVTSNSSLLAVMSDRWQVPAVDTLTGDHGAMHRVDTSGGDVTINLPASIPGSVGQPIVGKKTDAGANNVIMNPAGGDTINGADRTATANGAITLVDNGDGSWSTISVV